MLVRCLLVVLCCYLFSPVIIAQEGWPLLNLVHSEIRKGYYSNEIRQKDVEYGAIRGYLKSLNDPYTQFLDPKRYQLLLDQYRGDLFGIGVYIGFENDDLLVLSVLPNSPAYRSGIQPFDVIRSIDGQSAPSLSVTEASALIRGDWGSRVALTIYRPEIQAILMKSIRRDRIRVPVVTHANMLKQGIGYLRLSSFDQQATVSECRTAIAKLAQENLTCLVLDLRNNSGGIVSYALQIANFLLGEGVVMYTVDQKGRVLPSNSNGETLLSVPIVVLVNKGTASSAEILAGAIRDRQKGILVGSHTFGKASIQELFELPDGAAILYTTERYLTPSRVDISQKGLSVDISLDQIEEGELEALDQIYQDAITIILEDIGS